MKILAMAASNSRTSLNGQLIQHAANLLTEELFPGSEVEILDLNDFEMPLYSPERQENGIPEQAQTFFSKIGESDAVVLSYAEHNGSFSAAYKNLYDWASRIDMQVYQDKQVVMFATSPGGRGGAGVLATATGTAAFFGADLRASLSIPSFHKAFDAEKGAFIDDDLAAQFRAALASLGDS